MRPFLLTLLLSPLLRTTAASHAKRAAIPALQHPICRRNFTCAAPYQQNFQVIMADLNKEELESLDRLAEPAAKECEILGENKSREEALKEGMVEEKKEEEPKLPKLSAAEFRTYNSMAEHMEYFVSSL
jgi:hypothetical protein